MSSDNFDEDNKMEFHKRIIRRIAIVRISINKNERLKMPAVLTLDCFEQMNPQPPHQSKGRINPKPNNNQAATDSPFSQHPLF
jgi:hypothetical protein